MTYPTKNAAASPPVDPVWEVRWSDSRAAPTRYHTLADAFAAQVIDHNATGRMSTLWHLTGRTWAPHPTPRTTT